jgi:hypothetical protein
MKTGYLSDRKCYWKPLKILLTTVLTLICIWCIDVPRVMNTKSTKSMHINTELRTLKYHGSCFDFLDTHSNATSASADTLITQLLQFQNNTLVFFAWNIIPVLALTRDGPLAPGNLGVSFEDTKCLEKWFTQLPDGIVTIANIYLSFTIACSMWYIGVW